jgi:hypothetical protein
MSLELELVWFVVVFAGVIALSWFGKGSCGLSLSYLISLGFIHFWGGFIHALSWYHGGQADFTLLGFDQFTWAISGFAFGNCALSTLIVKAIPSKELRPPMAGLAKVALILGVLLYGFLRVALSNVPSIGALATCGGSLFIAGVCLLGWEYLQRGNYLGVGLILLSLSFLPFFTIVSAGFLGYGAAAALVVVAFLSCQLRNWMVSWVLLSLTIYFGFCTFMTYMRDRSDIRDEMWDEDSTFAQRFDRIKKTFTNFETVNFSDQDQLDRIEGRLNQNDLVGRAVYMLDLGEVRFAQGETFRQAGISIVPRILWPEKPVTAGSPDIVSYYTGVPFAPGTSVGVGQVMEGYINYGTPGVVILFLIFGITLGILDARAARKLRDGDTLAFMTWFVPGIALLQPGGSLVDVGTTTAASIVLVQLLKIPFALRTKKAAREAREILAARRTAVSRTVTTDR